MCKCHHAQISIRRALLSLGISLRSNTRLASSLAHLPWTSQARRKCARGGAERELLMSNFGRSRRLAQRRQFVYWGIKLRALALSVLRRHSPVTKQAALPDLGIKHLVFLAAEPNCFGA